MTQESTDFNLVVICFSLVVIRGGGLRKSARELVVIRWYLISCFAHRINSQDISRTKQPREVGCVIAIELAFEYRVNGSCILGSRDSNFDFFL